MKMTTCMNGKIEITKPCRKLEFCPYGALVEYFPLPEFDDEYKSACSVFGHICPVFFEGVAELVKD
jgi:hypothetical protein